MPSDAVWMVLGNCCPPSLRAEGGAKHAGVGVCVNRVFDFRKNGDDAIFEAGLYVIRLFVVGKKL